MNEPPTDRTYAMGSELTSRRPATQGRTPSDRMQRLVGEATGPSPEDTSVEMHLVTLDGQGRVPLRRPAAVMGWAAGDEVEFDVQDSVLRLTGATPGHAAMTLPLDTRLRLLLPYGVRATTAFQPGTRLVVLVLPDDGVVAAAPLADLIMRLVGDL